MKVISARYIGGDYKAVLSEAAAIASELESDGRKGAARTMWKLRNSLDDCRFQRDCAIEALREADSTRIVCGRPTPDGWARNEECSLRDGHGGACANYRGEK